MQQPWGTIGIGLYGTSLYGIVVCELPERIYISSASPRINGIKSGNENN